MPQPRRGPRRSSPARSGLLGTRLLGAAAAAALVVGLLSDAFDGAFWARHALTASLVASVLVIMLSAGILNEAVERRRRRRWSVLAQHVMLELVVIARIFWIGVLDLARVLPPPEVQRRAAETNTTVIDPAALDVELRSLLADPPRRRELQASLAALVPQHDELLGRWAAVMLEADAYAEVIDRHVEFGGASAMILSVLDLADPPDDVARRLRARASLAGRSAEPHDDAAIAAFTVRVAQLAEDLDHSTFSLAMQVVPVEWWQGRFQTPPPPDTTAR